MAARTGQQDQGPEPRPGIAPVPALSSLRPTTQGKKRLMGEKRFVSVCAPALEIRAAAGRNFAPRRTSGSARGPAEVHLVLRRVTLM